MKKLSITVFLCLLVNCLFAQNCGLVDSVITTIADNGNGTSDYSFKVYKSTTSGGGKSVAITLYCGTDTFVNGDCQITTTFQDSVLYGPYTITTCATQIFLDWTGHTNTICGGTSCRDSSGIAVPVTWLSSALVCNASKSMLQWQTASEINNKGFEVEYKTADGKWFTVGSVQGQTYSNSINSYQFEVTDYLLLATYFRIKQEDFNGTSSYSELIKNECDNANEIRFYPNPVKTKLHFSNTVMNFSIIDTYGRLVINGNECDEIDLSELKNGFYYLRYSNGFQQYVKPLIRL